MYWNFLMPRYVAAAMFAAMLPGTASADEAYIRVVDVGAGLCVVAVAPGGHAMLYDAGRGQPLCREAVRELVSRRTLDLVVLSHSDADHIRELPAILADNEAAVIVHPGDPRGPLLDPVRSAIDGAAAKGADVWNLFERSIVPGRTFPIGAASARFIAGWSDGNATRGPGEPTLDTSGRNNALSIVISFEYGGRSVLLTGDAVGRPISNDDTHCQYSERIMVANAANVPIKSDVLIGQHHGADNATSNCFIRAVRPEYVVFSAGHHYRHPRQSAVDRLVAAGTDPAKIFRTDRGDHEGGQGRAKEWITGSLRGCKDKTGDDDVEIRIPSDPAIPIRVSYRSPSSGC